ncbi:hypothetical protein SDC9_192476 [bioreactor metagenome]|uniref:Uncharacterized protein n=1 Tax=bioreactor metagenome TaxID=1076179 RepID=A0A645I377_9ZZZZ
MLKEERFKIIMKQINLHNKVLSVDLSKLLNVSEETISNFPVRPLIAEKLNLSKRHQVSDLSDINFLITELDNDDPIFSKYIKE